MNKDEESCAQCGADPSMPDGEDCGELFACGACGRIICEHCAAGGLCDSCDVEAMLE
jgi:hypothetical protein